MKRTPSPREPQQLYAPEFFRREDEGDDMQFYTQPRLVVHIDDYAIAAIGAFFENTLPRDGVILDLMSSWRSHLPEHFPKRRLLGLGLNDTEMAENPQLDGRVVHDLNSDLALPFDDRFFDAAVVTVSIQYIVRPMQVFKEVNRVLRDGAGFHVIYSNRMFPTKAVAIWRSLDDRQRGQLIASYFANSGGWEHVTELDVSPRLGFPSDPVYVVTARRRGEAVS